MLSKEEAIKELVEYDHAFLSPEGANTIGEPFGIKHNGEYQINTPHIFKGLNCPGYKDGEKVFGIDSSELAEKICKKEKVEYLKLFGRGSQLRECCEKMLISLKKEVK